MSNDAAMEFMVQSKQYCLLLEKGIGPIMSILQLCTVLMDKSKHEQVAFPL